MSVQCAMPDQDDYPDRTQPPFEASDWRTPDGVCDHSYCIEADWYRRAYSRVPRSPSRDELAEMNADRELVLDETGGRGF